MRQHLKESRYTFKVVRKPRMITTPDWALKANWKEPNIHIAQKFGVSREWVRRWRDSLGKPKVEFRGRKPKSGNHSCHT